MIERLEIIKAKYDELQAELMKPETLSNVNKTTELSREIANLEETVTCYNRYLEVEQQIKEAKELAKDPELGEMARLELDEGCAGFLEQ